MSSTFSNHNHHLNLSLNLEMNCLRSSISRNCSSSLFKKQVTSPLLPGSRQSTSRHFSSSTTSNRDHDGSTRESLYEGHIPLSPLQKSFMTIGSALVSFQNPARGDMIATLTETSSGPFLDKLYQQMKSTQSGRRLLIEQPTINSESVDMDYLRSLPDNTFGKNYVKWLDWNGVTPDTRAKVQFIDSPTHRYVLQRYRESHDFYHLINLMPVSTLGETIIKYFEAAHFNLPVAYLSSIGGPFGLNRNELIKLFTSGLIPWALENGRNCKPLIGIEWEKCWELDFEKMRREIGLKDSAVKVDYRKGERKAKSKRTPWPSKVSSS